MTPMNMGDETQEKTSYQEHIKIDEEMRHKVIQHIQSCANQTLFPDAY